MDQNQMCVLDDGTKLYHYSFETVCNKMSSKGYTRPNELFDIVAGQYEGGLKVWEGSIDLCNFISERPFTVEGCNVLELGCGAALPSILAFKLRAASVTVQDFNDFVIECFTKPNFDLNGISESSFNSASGNWSECSQMFAGKRFDVILTSETIYNTKMYGPLHMAFNDLLTSDGKVFLAAKTFYFGVGGSLPAFEEYIQQQNIFNSETAWNSETAIPRKIIKLVRKTKSNM